MDAGAAADEGAGASDASTTAGAGAGVGADAGAEAETEAEAEAAAAAGCSAVLLEEARFFRGPAAGSPARAGEGPALRRLRQPPSAASLRLARELGLCESEDAAQRRWREGERERRVAHALLKSRLLLCTVDG